MSVEIVLADERHFEDAWRLLAEYFETVQVVVRDDRSSLSKYWIWLAYVDATPAGCILLRRMQPHAGEVKRLYVRPDFRGQRIAGQLLAALEMHAPQLGLTELYLDSKDDLVDAIRFYERSGYVSCERYNDNPQATVFMRKTIST